MNIDALVESFYKQEETEKLVNEVLQFLMPPPLTEDKGARARERIIRLPNLMATEISVGQKPDSEDRQQFEIWMKNIGFAKGGADASAVSQKLTALTTFFAAPEASLQDASIPKMLSYLMFLNQFVYMLKEFNASVAGFLWEPFLAALFGDKSIQVPTSKGDIADIRIYAMGNKDMPISLKILNEAGQVKGSFKDLVKHFAGYDGNKPGKEMRYVIVVKHQSDKKKQISGVTFYEFNITADSFFEWIGSVAYGETIIAKDKEFKAARDLKEAWLQHKGGQNARYEIRHAKHGLRQTGERTGKVGFDWAPIARRNPEDKQYYIDPAGAQEINLRLRDGSPALEGLFDPDAYYIASVADVASGKKGGGVKLKKGYEAMPGTETKDTVRLWGGKDKLAAWSNLATSLKEAGHPPSVFFQAVLGNPPPEGFDWPGQAAPGARSSRGQSSDEKGGTQFHISPTHYKGLGVGGDKGIGSIKLTDAEVVKFFKEAAANMNEELITMFNKLADLNDNIGRFFLADCDDKPGGISTCDDKDAAARTRHGQAAIKDAMELEAAVVDSVSGMMGGAKGAP